MYLFICIRDKYFKKLFSSVDLHQACKITSPASTRILLGIMGEDSGYLTLNQMKAYITENNLTNYNKDTLTTGDIYNYVIENLSATGVTTEVIIELTTAIPRYAELRRYSLAFCDIGFHLIKG
jgi:hypothetical protein